MYLIMYIIFVHILILILRLTHIIHSYHCLMNCSLVFMQRIRHVDLKTKCFFLCKKTLYIL